MQSCLLFFSGTVLMAMRVAAFSSFRLSVHHSTDRVEPKLSLGCGCGINDRILVQSQRHANICIQHGRTLAVQCLSIVCAGVGLGGTRSQRSMLTTWCFSTPPDSKQSRAQAKRAAQPREATKGKRQPHMLSRIIQGLTRPNTEEEEDYETASEGVSMSGSPPRVSDGGHLTARSSASGGGGQSCRASASGGGGSGGGGGFEPAQQQQQSEGEWRGGSFGSGRWGGVLGGVPFRVPERILNLLSPRASEDQEAGGELGDTGMDDDESGGMHRQWQRRQQQQGDAEGPPDLQRKSGSYPAVQPAAEVLGGGDAAADADAGAAERDAFAAAAAAAAEAALEAPTTPPSPLTAPDDARLPELSEPSALMGDAHLRALATAVPVRHRAARWRLLYSTLRDGISLHTMLRACRAKAPTVLVVRDRGRHVFGAFCSEAWQPKQPRYYGTGETFVFQLEPRQVAWFWWWQKMSKQRNDFFMWGGQDSIAVGGAGGYALYLDETLSRGLSRNSLTFGNDSLASEEEFRVGAVELWWLS